MKIRMALIAAACVLGAGLALNARADDATAPAKPQTAAEKHAEYCKEHKDECAKRRAERHAKWCKAHPEKCDKAADKKEGDKDAAPTKTN